MQIDWFTFAAQIVNFLILVWLLRRFLYGPIVTAMAEREERIADRFEEAREKEETAEAEAARYRQKQEELASIREVKIEEAEREAHERRRELVEEAREEVDRLEEQWTEALRRERDTFLHDLAQRVSRETLTLVRQALQELADADLERQVIRVFIDRLDAMDEEGREKVTEAVEAETGDVLIRTAFELDDDQRQALTDALRDVTGGEPTPDFERDDEFGVGIELRAGGRKIAWSLDSYISDLKDRIRTRIDAEIGANGPPSSPEQREEQQIGASSSNFPPDAS